MKKGLLWMLFWEFFFVMFILPWVWLPIVLGMFDNDEPKWLRWICNQSVGNFN